MDSEGREVLTYIDGQVPADLGCFSDSQVRAAARIIRRYHDATAATDLSAGQQVVCHGDLSPCNFVFKSGTPSCLIDFDGAFPGPRRIDIGYAAWLWLDIGNPELDPYDMGRRIAVFLGEYGPDSPTDPTQAIVDSQDWLYARNLNAGCTRAEEVAAWTRCCRRWVEDHRVLLEAGLRTHAA